MTTGSGVDAVPLASIIIPIHNAPGADRSGMLEALLRTIPDRADIEILLVDDHSPCPVQPTQMFHAASLRQVDAPQGSRFAGPARNHGLALARGAWIIFADSDDRFDRAGLDSLISSLADEQHDVVMFMTRSFIEAADGSRHHGARHHYFNRLLIDVLDGAEPESLVRFISPWGRAVRRSLITRHGITFGSSRVAEDMTFATALTIARPAIRIERRALYDIREGEASITFRPSARNALDALVARRNSNLRLTAAGLYRHTTPTLPDLLKLARLAPHRALLELPATLLPGAHLLPTPKDVVRMVRRRLPGRRRAYLQQDPSVLAA